MNFATLQGLTIPEGVVTQITDASGRVLWSAVKSVPAVLQVEMIAATTYAAETTYDGEEFILLDIYPKTNGKVKVTFGGLTKTITDTSGAAEPNAQQVYFGTFNGVYDGANAPSGELVIEGDYYAYGCGSFQNGSKTTNIGYCSCITAISEWGSITQIAPNAFRNCDKLNIGAIPEGIVSIGASAFAMTYTNYTWVTPMSGGTLILPSTLQSIGNYAFGSSYTSGTDTKYAYYLGSLIFRATTPPTLGTNAVFQTVGNLVGVNCVVPQGCRDAYLDAGYHPNLVKEAS